jgi:hypothetical protein
MPDAHNLPSSYPRRGVGTQLRTNQRKMNEVLGFIIIQLVR